MSIDPNLNDYAAKVKAAEEAKAAAIAAAKEELAALEERRQYLKTLIGRKARVRNPKKPPEVTP